MLTFIQVETEEHVASAQTLFREYETSLGLDLCFQGFEAELACLPGKYVPPEGRLLIAYEDENLAGCIAMRKLDDKICEMKRLFVRGDFRGLGFGNSLIERLIAEASAIGYQRMRLDTHPPKMAKAVSLYESHGFLPIMPYYDNPNDGVLFMELTL